ncbi:MAG TPA: M20/M25/M40 family metallo-hydrolase [Thermoanaerobaculia bacterium]|nr:M20/M25/M40 family metallo-hydrolase [Thermoanaerobaculia bacterium]
MRRLRRNSTALFIALLLVLPAIADDGFTREAEDIFVSYLRINTSNPPGNETAGARFLQQILVREGIDAKLVGSSPARQSVYARLSSGTNEKALVLLHHIDVVPADTSVWTKPPFAGIRANGYIFGRGALDMKSIGIAELMAMIDIKRRHLPLRRDLIYLGVADEERGGIHGCKELLETHPELFANVGYVLNEAGYNETYVDRVGFWGIEVQQKVPLFLRIHMKGFAGHAASPPQDGGTLAKLVDVLEKVKAIPTPYRVTAAVRQSFAIIGAWKNDYKGEALRALARGGDVARAARVLPDGFRSLLQDTIAITQIHGGVCTNCLPSEAIADVDIRVLDDEKPDAMLDKMQSLMPKDARLEVLLEGEPTRASSTQTDLYRLLAADMTKSEPGSKAGPIVSAGTSDSRYFRARGIEAYGIAPFKVNYYDADTVHAADERIRAKFFDEGVALMRKIVEDFCTKR